MRDTKPTIKMPELLVFAKSVFIGFLIAEVWYAAFYLGSNSYREIEGLGLCGLAILFLIVPSLFIFYAFKRGAFAITTKIARSKRVDLLTAFIGGVCLQKLSLSATLAKDIHAVFQSAPPHLALVTLAVLCTFLFFPLLPEWRKPQDRNGQINFISDEGIHDEDEDQLLIKEQAKSFAENVINNGVLPEFVFGVDGAWGVGKTSFINIAEHHWKKPENKIIVCRFEPLRYASEPDLADRLIRDVSAEIQQQVFAPEFKSAASRYSRLIKGKADLSFFGFKLSLEPSHETLDDLLEDINEVLKRIDRRLIIVIDDLDRLDSKTVNNVLFATRRTFKLSQATYVLLYDTELLANRNEENLKAREFLEKFVNVKISLFIDSKMVSNYLREGWIRSGKTPDTSSAYKIDEISSILKALADILEGEYAAAYLPLVGDLRKVKRLINALFMMQIEKSNLSRTDFDKKDLINLVLLHLNYPGVFRQIYAEETEKRKGSFSVTRKASNESFKNSDELSKLITQNEESAASFLLKQLFDVDTLKLNHKFVGVDEATWASKACFNQEGYRNLESYLKRIVRFITPEPQTTYILYKEAVERVRLGESVHSVLGSSDFNLQNGEHAHEQFWTMLSNQSYNLDDSRIDDAISTLIKLLPHYSSARNQHIGLRQRSIYTLLRILDMAGWHKVSGRRYTDGDDVIQIAWRIFGEESYRDQGLLSKLIKQNHGVLGWYDLLTFRLICSADRQGQIHNIRNALMRNQDTNARTNGSLRDLTVLEMRKLSQEIFKLFEETYIKHQRNFLADVDATPDAAFLATTDSQNSKAADNLAQTDEASITSSVITLQTKTTVKSFVIYQLSNTLPPTGSGVGCGYYDVAGNADNHGIAKRMNEYMFDICFNPELDENNILLFLDYCLSHLSNSFFAEKFEANHIATIEGIPGSLDPIEMGNYWKKNRAHISKVHLQNIGREVITHNYHASYSEDLEDVFKVLDQLAAKSTADNTN